MQYLCLAYGDRKKMEGLSKAQFEALVARCQEHDAQLKASGHLVSASSLEWDTVMIRPSKGKPHVTDGPFSETKEQVGGVIIIEARDLADAIRIASLHPAAHLGEDLGWYIEVRPYADGCHQ
jgi:hypothetical protein